MHTFVLNKLNFEDKPDYKYLISQFKAIMTNYKIEDDGIYDWIKPVPKSILKNPLQNKIIIDNSTIVEDQENEELSSSGESSNSNRSASSSSSNSSNQSSISGSSESSEEESGQSSVVESKNSSQTNSILSSSVIHSQLGKTSVNSKIYDNRPLLNANPLEAYEMKSKLISNQRTSNYNINAEKAFK